MRVPTKTPRRKEDAERTSFPFCAGEWQVLRWVPGRSSATIESPRHECSSAVFESFGFVHGGQRYPSQGLISAPSFLRGAIES